MKIYIRTEEKKVFTVPVPIWVLKLGCGNISKYLIANNMPVKYVKYVEEIDFKELRKGIDVLKEYRGLKIVEVKAKDGSGVTIII